MALREFFAERYSDAIRSICLPGDLMFIENGGGVAVLRPDPGDQRNQREIALLSTEEKWALEYISIRRMQPLLEAIDDDASSFITVSEINAFTSARPAYWRFVR